MNPLISLVIPVYNVEKYLDKCMESVLNQTYDNYEVILVDDGSTDNSGKMCDEYAKKDSRITVYHKLNGGLSDARNYGVEHSNADLISFIDSDDYVSEDYLERLWNAMEITKADISVVGSNVVWETSQQYAAGLGREKQNDLIILDKEKALADMFYGTHFGVSACAKIFPKEKVKRHLFPVGELYEDLMTTYKIFDDCHTVVYDMTPCYCYVQRAGSISHGKNLDDRYWNALDKTEKIIKQFEHKNKTLAKAAQSRYAMLSLSYMNFIRDGKEENKMAFKKIVYKMKKICGGGYSLILL